MGFKKIYFDVSMLCSDDEVCLVDVEIVKCVVLMC